MENGFNVCSSSPALYGKTVRKSKLYRAYAFIHLVLLVGFLTYRLLHPLAECFGLWIIAFACELCFAFHWILNHNLKWLYVDYTAYPERLANRFSGESASKLPAVDIIITTTDPYKEPAILTANTVLSVLAFDYPVEKIACYVSDDGASPITFYSLVETLNFAKKWVPFCRKFNIETRAPFMYFTKETSACDSKFLQEWHDMKDEYESFQERINKALKKGQAPLNSTYQGIDGFVYTSSDRRNHSSVVQVIHENQGVQENESDSVPNLIYVAREKRPKVDHHYKAGAMNLMARISGVMTNAPFILNLDCDMHVSNPKAIKQAMCFFLDCPSERECGFVQFPQLFYGGLKHDPFGNQFRLHMKTMAKGMNGIQGPFYFGTCCFHRRKALYGVPPATEKGNEFHYNLYSCSEETLRSTFGESSALVASAKAIMKYIGCYKISSSSFAIEEALKVASCSYEVHTAWGNKVGWMYGATAEDVMTGLKIHNLGWHSIYYMPDEVAFMGSAPGNCPDSLVQQKRWGTGLLEILISKLSPFLGMDRHIKLRQRMVYAYFTLWAAWSVPTLCYAILPAFSLISGKSFLSKILEPAVSIGVALFISVNGFGLWEYVFYGFSAREWWNNQRMWVIVCISSWLFALFDIAKKIVGLSETVFVVTPKGSSEDDEEVHEGDFTFNSSPLFILPTTVLLINLAAIFQSTRSYVSGGYKMREKPFAEYFCSIWVVFNLLPFLKGLVRKGKRGIPWIIVIKSSALTLVLWAAWAQLK